MREQLWWYVARSGGIVALLLTGLAVIWGLLYSTKILNGQPSPKWLLDLHRFLGGASVVFTGIHLSGLVLDDFVSFGLTDILVPFASDWQPGAVAWGVVTMYLLLAVEITSLMMKRLPRRWWYRVHLTSYVLFWMGLVHGVTAGSDADNVLYIFFTGVSIIVVLGLTMYRILTQRRLQHRPLPAAA